MESVLNKLRDHVASTVYQVSANLSTALPGNVLTREYEVMRHLGSAGSMLSWKIYEAVKKSTKQEAALFVFERKQLEKYAKKDREMILAVVRKGVSQLTRLRHPAMLTVHHGIEESRDCLAFATEPVVASLANLLGDHENMPTPLPSELDGFEFYDVEIKYGLLQISEGLTFLHNDVKMLHRNLSPENVIVNRNGSWKISGFDLCEMTINPNENPLKFAKFINLFNFNETPRLVLPNFDYVSPDYCDRKSASDTVETSADMFSLGLLTYTLYNKGKPLLPTGGTINASRVDQFKRIPSGIFDCIPQDSREHIKLLLSLDTNLRPDANQFSKLHFFEDVQVKTLQYLDSLYQWDNLQKSHFYKGLAEVLSRMPHRVKLHQVTSCLSKEFVNPEMVPFVLPNIFLIAQESTDEEFQKFIFPELVSVFKMQEPIQIGIILMQNMDLLVSKCKSQPASLKEHILPLIYRSLEAEHAQQIQELCLSVVPSLSPLVDYQSMKNGLFPRLKKVALTTKLLSVRVNCLICIGKILDHLDKWLVLDEVLPMMNDVPSREPAVIMAIIGIYKLIMGNNKLVITKDVIATRAIPFLVPLSVENGLSLQQFQGIMSLIHELLRKVEEEHTVKLEQLNSIKSQHDTLFNSVSNSKVSPSQSVDSFLPNSLSMLSTANNTQAISTNANKTLSLEEKERLAKEKEQQERFRSQPSLVLQQQVTRNESAKPKDLTSTLIGSNLANLSLTQTKSQTQPNYFANTNNSMGSTSQMSSPPFQVFQSHQTSQFSFGQQMPVLPIGSYSSTQPIRPNTNTSPFDQIIIPDLKNSNQTRGSTPLNQLMSNSSSPSHFGSFNSHLQPQHLSPLSVQPNCPKPLSKTELDDFLN